MILATTMAGVSEAINLSEKINLNTQKLFEVVSTSTAFSWAINNYFPVANIGPESPADKAGHSRSRRAPDLPHGAFSPDRFWGTGGQPPAHP